MIVALMVTSCKTPQKTKSNDSANLFSMKSTSCMGECPLYELSIDESYTVYFNGIQYTNISGKMSKKLSAEDKKMVMGVIEKVKWSKLEDKYTSNMSDLPSYVFSYQSNGMIKKVSQYGSEPESLNALRKNLLAIVDQKDFYK